MKILFWNVQGICSKLDYLSLLADKYNLEIIAVAEHWIKHAESTLFSIIGYKAASAYSRFNKVHGVQ